MKPLLVLMLSAMLALAGCAGSGSDTVQYGPDGKPLPKVYWIHPNDVSKVTYRMLDGINAERKHAGEAPLTLNSDLTAAAATHSRDMSVQNRPWHFGSDGSSPIDRVKRTGYPGNFLGEDISETYETELTTLAAWMGRKDTRDVILNPKATNVGFAWYQENNGKIWWTLVTGD
ncbi:CAP domain-containing protein [Solirhodobacter olei]|uniref:CAP domain-containing protein n=1 Tax=Solirhodobacter olei TaxID=2493082 RepID=UPI000FD6CEC3